MTREEIILGIKIRSKSSVALEKHSVRYEQTRKAATATRDIYVQAGVNKTRNLFHFSRSIFIPNSRGSSVCACQMGELRGLISIYVHITLF